jgi:hypothetical protein
MTPEIDDDRIAELLRADAPAAHDPLFRISVLERRERNRFRRLALMLGVIALALSVIAAIGVSAGGDTAVTAVVLVIAVILAAAYTLYRPAVTRLLQRFGF